MMNDSTPAKKTGKLFATLRPEWKRLQSCLLVITVFCIGKTVLADSTLTADNVGQGLFAIPSLSPGHLFRPNITMVAPSYAPQGSWVSFTSVTWANIWDVNQGHYRIDGEWLFLSSKLSYVPYDNIEVGLCIPVVGRMGGFGDGLIEGFHNSFNLRNAGRDRYPRDEMVIEVNPDDGKKVVYEGSEWGLGDINLFGSWIVTRGGRIMPCTAIELGITLPTGDEDKLLGSGDPGFGMAVLMTKRIGSSRWIANLGASGSYCNRDKTLGIEVNREQFTLLSGLEYEWSSRLSLIMQELMSSPFAKDFYDLSKPTNELNAGFKLRIGELGTMEFSVQEDLFNFNNSADFGLHIGYRQIF